MGRILHFALRMRISYFSFKSLSRSKVTLLDEILLNVIIRYWVDTTDCIFINKDFLCTPTWLRNTVKTQI